MSRTYPAGYRTDVIDVPIKGNNGEVEYMIRMKAGDTVVYAWEAPGVSNSKSFNAEFHGHTELAPGQPGDLMFYEKAAGSKASGLFDRALAGHPWLVSAKRERERGDGAPAHGGVLRAHSGSGRTKRQKVSRLIWQD